jgi:hypothetical protein
MTKKPKEATLEGPSPNRHARICAERMQARVAEAKRRAEEYEATLDPRDRERFPEPGV